MKKVFNLIIVDESGSMSCIRKQAFAGMNETLATVRQMQNKFEDTDQRVTLITFDSEHIKWHYDNTPASKTTDLKWKDYSPCAATPLYDAMGNAISKVNAQAGNDDNVLVTVITDGDNLDVESMAHDMAIDEHLEFHQDAEETKRMFVCERRSRERYNEYVACDAQMPKGSFFKED